MGQKGYGRSIPEWQQQGRLPPDVDGENIYEEVDKRAIPWVLSRQKQNEHGEWAVPTSHPELAETAERVVSDLLI